LTWSGAKRKKDGEKKDKTEKGEKTDKMATNGEEVVVSKHSKK